VPQLHHEEREVRRHVDLAQRRVELHAVVREHVVVEHQHVLEPQVAVTVAHPPGLGAPGEHVAAAGQEGVEEPLRRRQPRAVGTRKVQVQQGLEVLVDQALDPTGARRVGNRLDLRVEGSQPPPDPVRMLARQPPGAKQRVHRALLRQPPHLHRPLDALLAIVISQLQRAVPTDDRADPEVDRRRKPAVEPDLLVTKLAPALRLGVVEERQRNGLLDLEHPLAGPEDDGDGRSRTSTPSAGCG
jgi:hypothetical protein